MCFSVSVSVSFSLLSLQAVEIGPGLAGGCYVGALEWLTQVYRSASLLNSVILGEAE